MERIPVRQILAMSTAQLWAMPDRPFILEFDDGDLETDTRLTQYSWYTMVFNRLYPQAPVYKRYHIGKARIGMRTTAELIETSLFETKDWFDERGEGHLLDLDAARQVVYDTFQDIYNDFTWNVPQSVSSICILDFIDIVTHPKIKEINDNTKPSPNSIEHTYSAVKCVLLDENELVGNPVAKVAKSGLVSMGQILQCVSVRGYLTDINSRIFHTPVLKGYTHGITKLYESLIESRSASKALWFAKDPVADSEYFNRRMQLVCETLKHIHPGDCGSQHYIEWKITSSNFENLLGKFYLEDDGKLKPIIKRDRNKLIGRTLKTRSILKCQHLDPYGVCATCFGELANAIPAKTVLGHVSATTLCEILSQRVLSTKHLDGSTSVESFKISEHDQYYIREGSDESKLRLMAELKIADEVRLIVPHQYAPRLTDLHRVRHVRELPMERLAELVEVQLEIINDGAINTVTVSVSMGSRRAYFGELFLSFLKEVGWTTTSRGDFLIDLSDWDFEDDIFELPQRHLNTVEYMTMIENFIKASPSANKARDKSSKRMNSGSYSTTEEALFAFDDLINSKLSVNIAHLEAILLATMAIDPENHDHRMPVDRLNGVVGYYEDNMWFRSLSATMAYEKQGAVLSDIRTFILDNRPDHPLDYLVVGKSGVR